MLIFALLAANSTNTLLDSDGSPAQHADASCSVVASNSPTAINSSSAVTHPYVLSVSPFSFLDTSPPFHDCALRSSSAVRCTKGSRESAARWVKQNGRQRFFAKTGSLSSSSVIAWSSRKITDSRASQFGQMRADAEDACRSLLQVF